MIRSKHLSYDVVNVPFQGWVTFQHSFELYSKLSMSWGIWEFLYCEVFCRCHCLWDIFDFWRPLSSFMPVRLPSQFLLLPDWPPPWEQGPHSHTLLFLLWLHTCAIEILLPALLLFIPLPHFHLFWPVPYFDDPFWQNVTGEKEVTQLRALLSMCDLNGRCSVTCHRLWKKGRDCSLIVMCTCYFCSDWGTEEVAPRLVL